MNLGQALLRYKALTVRALRTNSPIILTAVGASGTISTAFLAGQASYRAAEIIDKETKFLSEDGSVELTLKEKIQLVWPLYIPPVVSGGLTVAAILTASHVQNKRIAALAAAYSLSEKALEEYREKTAEKIGEAKEQTLRDEISQDRVNNNPPPQNFYMMSAAGHVMCYDEYTGRHFMSDMETLRRAEFAVNKKIGVHGFASIGDFYSELGVYLSDNCEDFGWTQSKDMELRITAVIFEEKPVLAISYGYVSPLI